MTRARRALGPIAAVWLVCQAATLTLVPVLLGTSLAECTCIHGTDASCPMHRTAAAGSKVCVMQGLTTNATATLNSLFSVVGLMPAPLLATAPLPTASPVFLECSMATHRPSLPDPPPPRA
jgi:hypothetical protein